MHFQVSGSRHLLKVVIHLRNDMLTHIDTYVLLRFGRMRSKEEQLIQGHQLQITYGPNDQVIHHMCNEVITKELLLLSRQANFACHSQIMLLFYTSFLIIFVVAQKNDFLYVLLACRHSYFYIATIHLFQSNAIASIFNQIDSNCEMICEEPFRPFLFEIQNTKFCRI